MLTLSQSDDPRAYAVIGAALEVHRVLGTGFLESLYKDALEIEFKVRRIPYRREVLCNIHYKGKQLRGDYKVDFICFDEVVIEVKGRASIEPADHAQIISSLAATKREVGLLLNLGAEKLEYRQVVRSL